MIIHRKYADPIPYTYMIQGPMRTPHLRTVPLTHTDAHAAWCLGPPPDAEISGSRGGNWDLEDPATDGPLGYNTLGPRPPPPRIEA